ILSYWVQGEEIFCLRAVRKARRPRVSAEPSRKTFFSFLEEFFGGARKIKNCKESFSARQAAALRRLAADQRRFRFLDLWIRFGKIISKVCGRFKSAAMEELNITYKQAQELVGKYITNTITKLHLRETEVFMRALAKRFGED